MLIQPWPRLSKTPQAIHLKELVQKLKQLREADKDSFFDQDLEDNKAYSHELSNQIF
jgi:hypothetical protein